MQNCAYCLEETKNKKYCSLSCSSKNRPHTHPKSKRTQTCINCGKTTHNPKYCNKSCAAISNNTISPKRKAEVHNCLDCGEICSRNTLLRCQGCHIQKLKIKSHKHISDYGNKTLQECIDHALIHQAAKHKYQLVRAHAHRVAHAHKWATNECEKCGWDKHTELCHIKPISQFSTHSLLSEINSRDNISFLCPNCHWLLDSAEKPEHYRYANPAYFCNQSGSIETVKDFDCN